MNRVKNAYSVIVASMEFCYCLAEYMLGKKLEASRKK